MWSWRQDQIGHWVGSKNGTIPFSCVCHCALWIWMCVLNTFLDPFRVDLLLPVSIRSLCSEMCSSSNHTSTAVDKRKWRCYIFTLTKFWHDMPSLLQMCVCVCGTCIRETIIFISRQIHSRKCVWESILFISNHRIQKRIKMNQKWPFGIIYCT